MFIHYCDGCNIRVNSDESVHVGEKVFCKACAETKAPPQKAPAGGSGFHSRSASSGMHGRGAPTQRASPSSGLGTQVTPGTGARPTVTIAPRTAPRAGSSQFRPAVPPARSAAGGSDNRMAIWALGALGVVLALLGLLLMARGKNIANSPKTKPSTPETAVVAPGTTDTKNPGTAFGVKTAPVIEPPKLQSAENVMDEMREGLAQRKWEELQKGGPNPFELRKRYEAFVRSYRSTKAGKEAAEKLKTMALVGARVADKPKSTQPGLVVNAYEKNFDGETLTGVTISALNKIATKTIPQITFPNKDVLGQTFGRADALVLNCVGYVEIPKEGSYTFYTNSDDGSLFYIGDVQIINNDGSHAAREYGETLPLLAGKHKIKLDYCQGMGEGELHLSWSGPEIQKQLIPASALSHDE